MVIELDDSALTEEDMAFVQQWASDLKIPVPVLLGRILEGAMPLMHFFPPESNKPESEKLMALLRTARQLHPSDLEELRRYAEFRRARRIYKGKSRPGPGRKVKKT